ncbi:pyrimidine dimer DNA glycosylase/endonuclease V [Microbacterium sp. Marseille-Q6965]|uniref:pyrimidine dimer DNA glycosylase/endonuclease V n=1 Tax=Microbacterium sp. Marseille-Q6965 TaxID=2965072 RepID=UPI0021B83FCA|nr:pyrimidine dimer DNA glycosylase/endonuclease V [Microbacterium sp. Marseille-Q6965]
MRLWSLHPRYLDRQGLTACWREGLLAQAVLAGGTRGYTRHPQLERFRTCPDPLGAIGAYLEGVASEADRRGYRFDRNRIRAAADFEGPLTVADGQLRLEWALLLAKLGARSPDTATAWRGLREPDPHPLFVRVPGGVASWERAAWPSGEDASGPV